MENSQIKENRENTTKKKERNKNEYLVSVLGLILEKYKEADTRLIESVMHQWLR